MRSPGAHQQTSALAQGDTSYGVDETICCTDMVNHLAAALQHKYGNTDPVGNALVDAVREEVLNSNLGTFRIIE